MFSVSFYVLGEVSWGASAQSHWPRGYLSVKGKLDATIGLQE